MCGIVGYVGKGLAIPIVLDSLSRLEYRGYDSAGVAFVEGNKIVCEKRAGKLSNLVDDLKNKLISSSCAIGHTRWATNGEPTKNNAHPHLDSFGNVAIVHNGIIENYNELKQNLCKQGVIFTSQTDTEVIAQMLASELHNNRSVVEVIHSVTQKLKGSFALAILIKGYKQIYVTKRYSPIVIGLGNNENYIASDIPAILPFTNKIMHIKDDEIAILNNNGVDLYNNNLQSIKRKPRVVKTKLQDIMLGQYDSFMQKEIDEGASAVINTITRLQQFDITNKFDKSILIKPFHLHITACGTALHAGRIAKYLFEKLLKINVDLDYASEFRYKEPLIDKESICLFISQSGETADTLACLDLAKKSKAYTIGITNAISSKMANEVDFNIPTSAGIELAVASTKAYLAQLGAIYYIIDLFAQTMRKSSKIDLNKVLCIVKDNADKSYESELQTIVKDLANENSLFFVGRGLDYFLALEGALKVKEISYIHCEALPAGELKHGSLALIDKLSFVIVILTQENIFDKVINNINELKTRGAKIILITNKEVDISVYKKIVVPKVEDTYSPFVAIRPLQELAYLLAKYKGYNPDKPRNLAKSVTVE